MSAIPPTVSWFRSGFRANLLLAMGIFGSLLPLGKSLAEEVVTLDFPIQSEFKELPSGLSETPRQVATPDGKGYVEIALRPEMEGHDLLVTVVFLEDGTKGPSLSWFDEARTRQKILSENLAEGVTGPNQRTVQLPADLLATAGRLILFGDQSRILRVRLDWAARRPILAAADQRPVSYLTGDRLMQNTELTGDPLFSPPDTWFGQVLEAFLQEEQESLAEPVGFAVDLEQPVNRAVLSVKVLGLGLDQTLRVWVNDREAGRLQPAAPALTDPGYLTDQDGNTSYAGWRNAALFLPKDSLRPGENTLTLVSPGGPVYIREAALQLAGAPAAAASQEPEPIVIGGDAAAPATQIPGLISIP